MTKQHRRLHSSSLPAVLLPARLAPAAALPATQPPTLQAPCQLLPAKPSPSQWVHLRAAPHSSPPLRTHPKKPTSPPYTCRSPAHCSFRVSLESDQSIFKSKFKNRQITLRPFPPGRHDQPPLWAWRQMGLWPQQMAGRHCQYGNRHMQVQGVQ